ncbi:MAG: Phosphate butyryltransferase [Gemmatimonadetes bacterium]|nr:Phosphate butyryltransferase [Gemmatimonadota bacterium]
MASFEAFAVGQSRSRSMLITEQRIAAFAEVSGDANPIHLDASFAAKTMFQERIAHGMLLASFISAVLGNELPGLGTIYLSQTLRFTRPAHIGDTITAKVTITSLRPDKRLVELETECTNQNGEIVLSGVALTKYPA